jgi:hypothetical protein
MSEGKEETGQSNDDIFDGRKNLPEESILNDEKTALLTKEQFWDIIDEARNTTGKWQDMFEPLAEILLALEEPDIIRWCQIFMEYEELADKNKLQAAAAMIKNGCSDECFLEFRYWLIAQGKDVFMNALADPDSLADIAGVRAYRRELIASDLIHPLYGYINPPYFEEIEYAANQAYQCKEENNGSIYDVIDENPLSEQEKENIKGEITYAADIDDTGVGSHNFEELTEMYGESFPKLYNLFHVCYETETHKRTLQAATAINSEIRCFDEKSLSKPSIRGGLGDAKAVVAQNEKQITDASKKRDDASL